MSPTSSPSSSKVTFKGYALTSTEPSTWSDLSLVSFESKTWTEDDVEIAITYCGICGSDLHTLTGGWGEHKILPLVVGHEIVGKATRVGANVKEFKAGDRVGVGAQCWSCGECKDCKSGNEQYCEVMKWTYDSFYPNGEPTLGGYATGIVTNSRFVFRIPDALKDEEVCTMLCGGLTTFSPLVRNGVGAGTKVGVVGIGGLGHYAILWAKALGATVYAFSHGRSKEADVRKMGADHFVATEAGFEKNYKRELDVIICTRDAGEDFPITEFISMLGTHGKFIMCSIPDTPLPPIWPLNLIKNGSFIGGSAIGSKKEVIQMLQLAAGKGVRPWVEVMPMSEVTTALQKVRANHVRYRCVLKQDIDH